MVGKVRTTNPHSSLPIKISKLPFPALRENSRAIGVSSVLQGSGHYLNKMVKPDSTDFVIHSRNKVFGDQYVVPF